MRSIHVGEDGSNVMVTLLATYHKFCLPESWMAVSAGQSAFELWKRGRQLIAPQKAQALSCKAPCPEPWFTT